MKTDIGRSLRQEGAAIHWFAVLSQLSYNLSQRGVTMVGTFIAGYGAEMLWRRLQHISMVGVALVLAASIGVSLGVVISGHERVARWTASLSKTWWGRAGSC
jgi:ABC-type proline/glycine betaine transport system permease subunit